MLNWLITLLLLFRFDIVLSIPSAIIFFCLRNTCLSGPYKTSIIYSTSCLISSNVAKKRVMAKCRSIVTVIVTRFPWYGYSMIRSPTKGLTGKSWKWLNINNLRWNRRQWPPLVVKPWKGVKWSGPTKHGPIGAIHTRRFRERILHRLFQMDFHQHRIAELSNIAQNRVHGSQIPGRTFGLRMTWFKVFYKIYCFNYTI